MAERSRRPHRRPSRIRLFPLVLVGVLTIAACGSADRSPSGRSSPDSGVTGMITLGPACPVARQAAPCKARPYAARVLIRGLSDGRVVSTVHSSSTGRFRVDLAPGTYTLVPLSPRPGVPPVASAVPVTVVAHRHRAVTIQYDTGIR
jgi:hypothetical protein